MPGKKEVIERALARAPQVAPAHVTTHNDLELLRLIDEGTASQTGLAFFDALVRSLALALGTRFAFVSRFSADRAHVRVLAFWNGAGIDRDVEYDLAGTPCERVLDGEIVAFDRGGVGSLSRSGSSARSSPTRSRDRVRKPPCSTPRTSRSPPAAPRAISSRA